MRSIFYSGITGIQRRASADIGKSALPNALSPCLLPNQEARPPTRQTLRRSLRLHNPPRLCRSFAPVPLLPTERRLTPATHARLARRVRPTGVHPTRTRHRRGPAGRIPKRVRPTVPAIRTRFPNSRRNSFGKENTTNMETAVSPMPPG